MILVLIRELIEMKSQLQSRRTLIREVPNIPPNVGIICPACGGEVSFDEIIEKKGSVRCVDCLR